MEKKYTELQETLKALFNILILYINLENGGFLPSCIQILLLADLNILLNDKPG